MNARVVFSKKTQEKINKGLTRKERGELRWKKLEEASKDGRLSLCKTRRDVAALGGYTDGVAGTSWVHRLVSRGYLQEVHVGERGRYPEYTYFIMSKPNFLPFAGRYGIDASKKKPTKTIEQTKPTKPTKPTNTPLREIGEKRWEILEEANKSGRLAECKCRRDLIILAGYTNMVQGGSWLANLIRRGYIKETVVDGVSSYRIVKKPNYTYFTRKNKKVVETPKIEEPVVLSRAYVPESKAKLTIKTDIATVEIESVSAEIVEKVLEKVCATTKM
mgnify:CR=1 FL=1